MEADSEAIKILACGDGAIGKTSLLIFYQKKKFPKDHIPTIFENETIEKKATINGVEMDLSIDLWDTAGQEEFDRLRILAYPQTNIFLLCFCVVEPVSFKNLAAKWVPEIQHHEPAGQIVLVGTKSDLRAEKSQSEQVSMEEIEAYKNKINAVAYIETSALQNKNVDLCFETALNEYFNSGTVQTMDGSGGCCTLL